MTGYVYGGVDWREVLFDLRRLGLMPTNVARELRGAVSERQVRDYTEQLSEPSHVRAIAWSQVVFRPPPDCWAASAITRRPAALQAGSRNR
ncbi:hypothetical protein EGY19_10035 [Burkholderia multivorans]|uniref:hypothetical protein n=1 Tax=Burkholderia multivorans TaxID=87883 RepID=UPI000CFF6D76|nr:hypothetical protein [Burkholderia multivorans]AYY97747.1 hypothetical protein EGY19_10035 [Burkholderia multivorans]MBU9120046.1 hypothetical protein [Burkholderia multivorans]PRF48892.1 hypothetical protein C6Q04_10665 [Burkholderia multivorans]PRG54187.1 hypothetical protein C6T63_10205 [Burkholderia multivorans]